MVPIFLALFPVLLLVAPRFAWLALAAAVVMLAGKRVAPPRARSSVRRPYADTDASI